MAHDPTPHGFGWQSSMHVCDPALLEQRRSTQMGGVAAHSSTSVHVVPLPE